MIIIYTLLPASIISIYVCSLFFLVTTIFAKSTILSIAFIMGNVGEMALLLIMIHYLLLIMIHYLMIVAVDLTNSIVYITSAHSSMFISHSLIPVFIFSKISSYY